MVWKISPYSQFTNKEYKVTGKKAEKSRWDFIIDISNIIKQPPIKVSTWLKGFKTKDVEDILLKGTQGSFNPKRDLYELIMECKVK